MATGTMTRAPSVRVADAGGGSAHAAAYRNGCLPLHLRTYYALKPLMPRTLRVQMRRRWAGSIRRRNMASWPINPDSAGPPAGWKGWPHNRKFAVVLTHDVEGQRGLGKVMKTLHLDQRYGFRSSFNFVPERSHPTPGMRTMLPHYGFEVGVHGLRHDGLLVQSHERFAARATLINGYLESWHAVGFRAPSMHAHLPWFHELNIKYDLSTFENDPFEPFGVSMDTLFPFWVADSGRRPGYVELPYTLTQDYTLFVLLQERNIDIWKQQIDRAAAQGGMVLVNTHPDYMVFDGKSAAIDEYPAERYEALLSYLQQKYAGEYWHAIPKEIGSYCEGQWKTDP